MSALSRHFVFDKGNQCLLSPFFFFVEESVPALATFVFFKESVPSLATFFLLKESVPSLAAFLNERNQTPQHGIIFLFRPQDGALKKETRPPSLVSFAGFRGLFCSG